MDAIQLKQDLLKTVRAYIAHSVKYGLRRDEVTHLCYLLSDRLIEEGISMPAFPLMPNEIKVEPINILKHNISDLSFKGVIVYILTAFNCPMTSKQLHDEFNHKTGKELSLGSFSGQLSNLVKRDRTIRMLTGDGIYKNDPKWLYILTEWQ